MTTPGRSLANIKADLYDLARNFGLVSSLIERPQRQLTREETQQVARLNDWQRRAFLLADELAALEAAVPRPEEHICSDHRGWPTTRDGAACPTCSSAPAPPREGSQKETP